MTHFPLRHDEQKYFYVLCLDDLCFMHAFDFMCELHPKYVLHNMYLDSDSVTKLIEQLTTDQGPVMIQIYTEHLLMCQSG